MVGWHHRLNGHESEQAPGVGDGQGSLACCGPWGHKEVDATEQVNSTTSEKPLFQQITAAVRAQTNGEAASSLCLPSQDSSPFSRFFSPPSP